MPYLSPESLPSEVCTITLQIPNDELLRLAVMGQVYELSRPSLWELYGAVTPDDAAAAMYAAYNAALYCDSLCPPVELKNMFVASSNANQIPASGVPLLIAWEVEEVDTGNQFASNRFTATELGYWVFYAQLQFATAATVVLDIRKNNVMAATSTFTLSVLGNLTISVMKGFVVAPGDYFEIWATTSNTGLSLLKTGNRAVFMGIQVGG